jgi:uncharacterized protein YqgV (UPF0045/DUF77 family)
MKISVELSMYPLKEEYKAPIIEFVRSLRDSEGIRVKTNGMSSQIYGDYDQVMASLAAEIKTVFAGKDKVVMVMKMANDDLDGPVKF